MCAERRWRGDDSGATAVEFALVMPLFVAALIAIFQFGWAQHKLSSIRYAMEGASRQLMLNRSLTQAQMSSLVQARLQTIGDPNVTVSLAVSDTAGGQVAQLTGSYVSQMGVPGLASWPVNFTTSVSTALPAS